MEYRLVVPKKIRKKINRLDDKARDRVFSALRKITEDPFAGKKLEGDYKEQWSYRVWPYRVVYKIHKSELVVLVINVAHRQGVYK